MDKFLKWMQGAVDFMANMLKGDVATQIVKLVLSIVREVQATGKSGADKRALAFTLLVARLPEIIELAVALMKHEDKVAGCPGDKDCDSIPDSVDPCPTGDCPPNGTAPSEGLMGSDGKLAWTRSGTA